MSASAVVVTGAGGRLGRALVEALRAAGVEPIEWSRPEYDLDDPGAAARLVDRDQPALVFHAAAWTDVDGCARDPALALRRNGGATAELAAACATAGAGIVHVSTNEVFDGRRTDGAGYLESDPPAPANPYGSSKLAGEAAVQALIDRAARAWIVRTSWLFGPTGSDFPHRVIAAARPLVAGEPLAMVSDEIGRPTYAADLAGAIARLPEIAPPGIYHLANAGICSRFDWAEQVLRGCGRGTPLRAIALADYERPSTPPAWAVLDTAKAEGIGLGLRSWRDALADYLPVLCPA
jgi:dTDP-4-dehydrorhamnose reductase